MSRRYMLALYSKCDTFVDMRKTAHINARVEQRLKNEAEKVLHHVGVRTSDAVTMFLQQVVLQGGLPFEVRQPTKNTRAAIAELEGGGGMRFSGSTNRLLFELAAPKKKRV